MPRKPTQTLRQFRPQLAKQLVNPKDGNLAKGSSKKVMWRCLNHKGLIYEARIDNRAYSKNQTRCGCPVCNGKKVIPGINDIATTHPDIAKLFVNKKMALQHTAKSNKKALFQCEKKHPAWEVVISNVTGGTRCPYCSGRKAIPGVDDLATTHPELTKELVDPSQAHKLKAGSSTKQKWKCINNPSHPDWGASIHDRTKLGRGCPYCSGRKVSKGVSDLWSTHPKLAAQLVDPAQGYTVSFESQQKVLWKCDVCKHTWEAIVYNRTLRNSACPVCVNKTILPDVNSLAVTHPHVARLLADPKQAETVTPGSNKKLTWQCPDNPEHTWDARPYVMVASQPQKCPTCFPGSLPEQEVYDFIKKLLPGTDVISGDRDIISPRELDIVIPSMKIAVEFNGLLSHSTYRRPDPEYHRSKTEEAAREGYRLLHIWEDDWADKKAIVKSRIAYILGALRKLHEVDPSVPREYSETIYARKLHPKKISNIEGRQFWEKTHLAGAVNCDHTFALVDDDGRIRAALGVGKRNPGSLKPLTEGIYDIQRFAVLGSVPGGFSRLLTFAQENIPDVREWESFSDDDISEGSLYKANGFEVKEKYPPSYSYVGNRTGMKRRHRMSYMLHTFKNDSSLIYEEGWTEEEAATSNGLYRVYDAGRTKWSKMVKPEETD